jgi:hypothetical protein
MGNSITGYKKTKYERFDWIQLAKDRVQRQAVVNTEINILFP